MASELPPTEKLELLAPSHTRDEKDVMTYWVKPRLFTNVRNLTIFIEDNWSNGYSDETRLWYLGFKGEFKELKETPLITVYEVRFHSPQTFLDR